MNQKKNLNSEITDIEQSLDIKNFDSKGESNQHCSVMQWSIFFGAIKCILKNERIDVNLCLSIVFLIDQRLHEKLITR